MDDDLENYVIFCFKVRCANTSKNVGKFYVLELKAISEGVHKCSQCAV